MAASKSTLNKLTYNSTTPVNIGWSSFATGANNVYVDANGVDGSKVIFIVAHESTDVAAGTTVYVGTSDTATTRSAAADLYSAAGLNRMKVKLTPTTAGAVYTKFRSTGTTHLHTFTVLGPFETARFKDSDGYINFAKAKTGSTLAKFAAILLP